jgi:hypothetical protein
MPLVNRILNIFVYKIGFTNPIWISSFRIYGSLIFLFHFLSILPDFYTFWGQNAIVNPDIMDANTDNLMPTIYDIHQLINKYAALGFQTVANTIAIIYIISLISLALGLMSKISAAIALFTHLVLMQSINIFIYGVDFMTTICLFYLLIFPVGKYHSLDNYFLKKSNPENFDHGIFLRLFQIHWCLAYFFSGLSKALGPTWWNGEAIWKALNSYNQASLINPELWVHYPFIITFLGISTVLLELLFPIGVSVKNLRKTWIVSIILMHIAIGALLGLYFFSIVMILINLVGFWFPYFKSPTIFSR